MTFGRNMPLPIPMLEVPLGANVSPDPQPDARSLLSSVADALNACEAAGLKVKLKHGSVWTDGGYVLPLGEGAWGARTLAWTEFSAQAAGDDED